MGVQVSSPWPECLCLPLLEATRTPLHIHAQLHAGGGWRWPRLGMFITAAFRAGAWKKTPNFKCLILTSSLSSTEIQHICSGQTPSNVYTGEWQAELCPLFSFSGSLFTPRVSFLQFFLQGSFNISCPFRAGESKQVANKGCYFAYSCDKSQDVTPRSSQICPHGRCTWAQADRVCFCISPLQRQHCSQHSCVFLKTRHVRL